MATIFRAPLFSPGRPKKPDATHTRQFVSAGLALLTAVALPVGDAQNFELPDRPNDPRSARNWEITNDLARKTAVTLPVRQSEWPLAKSPKPSARDQQLQNTACLNTVVVVQAPFSQTDWPLIEPIRRTPQGWTVSLNLPATTLPFNQYDWPLIEPKRPRPSDWQRVNDLSRQIAVTLPFDLTEWPLPKRVDSPRGRNWELANDLGRQTAVTLPFSQTDWPLPDRADSPLARDRQRINDLGRQTAVTLPKQITEWPLAKPRRFLPPYWQPTNDLARKTFVRLPAQPYDWPLPKVARPKAPETPLPDTALLRTVVVVVKPFAQMGWELPQRTDSPIAREAWPYITILPEGAAQPFSQINWPLPLTGRPDVAPEIPANLLPIHVPPVPPEEFRPKGKIPHIEAWDLAHLRNQQWINQLRIVELWGAGDQSAVGALEAFVVVPTVEPSVSPATRRVVLLARPIAPWSAPGVASSAAAGAPSVVLLPDRVSEEQEIADAMAALRPYLGSIGLNKPSG